MTLISLLRRIPAVRAIEAAAYHRGQVDGSTAAAALLAKDLVSMRASIFMDGFFEGRASMEMVPLAEPAAKPPLRH